MENKKSYKEFINEIETKIHNYIKKGFMSFKLLGWKEFKIIEFKIRDKSIEFYLESKFKESYDTTIDIMELDDFLGNFKSFKPQQVIIRKEKEMCYELEGVKVGITQNYGNFKIITKSLNTLPFNQFSNSFSLFGNINPILVVEKNSQLIILDGRKRFDYLKSINQPIFYLDVTSMMKEQIGEKLFAQLNIFLNRPNLKNSWQYLCKYFYPQYRELEEFIKKNNVEKYISKYKFINTLESDLNIILTGKADFSKKQELLELILLHFDSSKNIDNASLKVYQQQLKGIKHRDVINGKFWYEKYLTDLSNTINYPILYLKGNNYNLRLIHSLEKFDVSFNKNEIIYYSDDNKLALRENEHLFKHILESEIDLDLNREVFEYYFKERNLALCSPEEDLIDLQSSIN